MRRFAPDCCSWWLWKCGVVVTSLLVVGLLQESTAQEERQNSDWSAVVADRKLDSDGDRVLLPPLSRTNRFLHLLNLVQRMSRLGLIQDEANGQNRDIENLSLDSKVEALKEEYERLRQLRREEHLLDASNSHNLVKKSQELDNFPLYLSKRNLCCSLDLYCVDCDDRKRRSA